MAELELMFLNLEFVLRVTDRLPSFYWQLDVFAVSAVAVEPNEREDEKRFSSLVELPPAGNLSPASSFSQRSETAQQHQRDRDLCELLRIDHRSTPTSCSVCRSGMRDPA